MKEEKQKNDSSKTWRKTCSKFEKANNEELRELLEKSHKMNCWNEEKYLEKVTSGKTINSNN